MIKRGSAALRRDGAARAALWLEAPRARARQLGAVSPFLSWLIPASQFSGVARNPSRALRVATRWPAATPDRTRPRVAGSGSYRGMVGRGQQPILRSSATPYKVLCIQRYAVKMGARAKVHSSAEGPLWRPRSPQRQHALDSAFTVVLAVQSELAFKALIALDAIEAAPGVGQLAQKSGEVDSGVPNEDLEVTLRHMNRDLV